MSPSRFLKLEILGCVLLVAVTLGMLFRAPKAPWEGKERRDGGTGESAVEAPGPAEGTGGAAPVRSAVPPLSFPPPKAKPPSKSVNGKLVVFDASGRELADRSGVLFLKVQLEGESAEVHRVTVTKGAFVLDAYEGCFLTCDTATIDDQYAVADLPWTAIPSDGSLVVHARIPPRTRLFVEDAMTAAPLADVILRKDSSRKSSPWDLEPGQLEKMEISVKPGPSPLEIPSDVSVIEPWVDVRGYAPQRVRIETTHGGDYVVRLHRAASLVVCIVPNPLPEEMALVVGYEGERLSALGARRLSGVVEPQRFERVRPGRFEAWVLSSKGSPLTRAESRTEIEAGETKQMVLELAPGAPHWTLRGTIHVPSAWPKSTMFELNAGGVEGEAYEPYVKRIADLPMVGGDPQERSFEIQRPRSRMVRFEIQSSGVAFERTAIECEQPLRLELPDAAIVRIRLRTEDGKLWTGNGSIPFRTSFGGVASHALPFPTGSNEDLWYIATTAPGEIEIESHDPVWVLLDGTRRKKVVVAPGDNEITLPICLAKEGLLVQFSVHGAVLSVPDATLCKVVVRRSNGDVLSGDPTAGGVFVPIGVRETLQIVPPQIDGYLPVAPFTVDVDPTTSKRIAIELTPAS